MNKLELLTDIFIDEEFISADGFDDAIIGVSELKPSGVYVIVYSISKCLKILMERDGMTYEEAIEYFDFNVAGAYVGEKTPIWVDDALFDDNAEPVDDVTSETE
jgi:hypothetical protein